MVLAFLLNQFGYDILLRSPLLIAFTTIVFGILLWVSDIKGREEKTTEDLTWKGATIMGFAQALALIPGTSRSGITMTTARFHEHDTRGKRTFFYADEPSYHWGRRIICVARINDEAKRQCGIVRWFNCGSALIPHSLCLYRAVYEVGV